MILRNRVYGLAFLLVVALLVGLSVATFQKRFVDIVPVTLHADRIGSQMQAAADVKIRGLIVGEVRTIRATSTGATLELALDPAMVAQIPAHVSARLLPKTLFGERFVDLVPPTGDQGRPIRAHDVIPQDRTTVAIELEKVFDDLLPLLRTVRPERLAATLNALATTLDGRGTRLGQNIVLVDRYLRELNPKMPAIAADISGLADLASTYADAAPDLLRTAKALLTTNATIVQKKDQLAGFLAGTAGFANTAADFLEANSDRLIQLGRVQRPTLEVLAKYAPTYPCLAKGLTAWLPHADGMFAGGQMHITVETAPQRSAYRPGQEPAWQDRRGPDCRGLPDPGGSQAHPAGHTRFADGTQGGGSQGGGSDAAGSALPSAFLAPSGVGIADPDSGLAGTAAEQRLVGALLDPTSAGATDAALATLLAGPILRGTVVSTR